MVRDAVIEGRRAVENAVKYILMGTSSNFGNMFSMAGAALVLPILPMLPVQVLLNNLLYDVSELGIPFDDVDAETLQKPVRWDLSLIKRFMLVLGPISSVFDFITFFILLRVFHAGAAEFQTGWFVESLATQALVVFAIRSRKLLFRSRPHPALAALTIGVVVGRPPAADGDRSLVRPGASAGELLRFRHCGRRLVSGDRRSDEAVAVRRARQDGQMIRMTRDNRLFAGAATVHLGQVHFPQTDSVFPAD